MATSTPTVSEETRHRLLELYKQGTKNAISVLNELGYHPKDYSCEEKERQVGPTNTKIFSCKLKVPGLPDFPAEEAKTKKKAKEAAAKHVAEHLLNQKGPEKIKPSPVSFSLTTPARTSKLTSDGGKESMLKKQFRDGSKTAASVLSEYAVMKGWPQPKMIETESPDSNTFGYVCLIGSTKFDVGMAMTKKDAKQVAASLALMKLFTDAPAIPSPVLGPKFQGSVPPSSPPPGGAGEAPQDATGGHPRLCLDEADEYYCMDSKPKGFVLILENVNIKNETPRLGSEKDASRLADTFTKRGFQVMPLAQYKDLSSADMQKKIKAFAKKDEHNSTSCCVLFILSHGRNGCVLGSDGEEVPIDSIVNIFQSSNAPALAGKPKFFGFQACRGDRWDSLATDGAGGQLVPDAVTRAQRRKALNTDHYTKLGRCIPEFADLFVAYSTNPGLVSWRDEDFGSVFVQAFCDVVSNNVGKDIHNLLTKVNKRVSDFEGDAEREGRKHKVKQISDCRHTLTKTWIL